MHTLRETHVNLMCLKRYVSVFENNIQVINWHGLKSILRPVWVVNICYTFFAKGQQLEQNIGKSRYFAITLATIIFQWVQLPKLEHSYQCYSY